MKMTFTSSWMCKKCEWKETTEAQEAVKVCPACGGQVDMDRQTLLEKVRAMKDEVVRSRRYMEEKEAVRRQFVYAYKQPRFK